MGLLDILKKSIFKDALNDEPVVGKNREYKEELFTVAGTDYYLKNIQKLACKNKDYGKKTKTLCDEGKAMCKIYKYNFTHKPVKLIPEPKNPHDKNAIVVQIAGEKVGHIYAEDNIHVNKILKKHDVKFISGFVGGGEYKVVSLSGDVEKLSERIYARVKIGYV